MRIAPQFLRLADAADKTARVTIIVLMAAMCIVIIAGVFWRYILNDALSWTEELGRYLMIWMGFLGIGPALREGGHVAVDVAINRLSGRSRRALIFLIRVLCITFPGAVVGAAFALIPKISNQITPVLGLSTSIPYLAIPVGCMLTIIEMLALMVRDPDLRPTETQTEAAIGVRS